ncbi:NYN domain-containing protein [Mesorhizobium sp. YC-39]|uniref:NYN domain-containing protein n=1 Tax=unclassified Mesorhizobium TaxID=325217 RepID=UPI0021E8DBCD|nr:MULTISPECIES: NYN domain-containing protein [unclassified Mesorhizobium]MCV3210037.1 NYN domain-containing protein [Mesorhizobium sp. YC-2]MCV3230567.1 NYN domain-containing protein [Mesorhizobium sp. YC-39]
MDGESLPSVAVLIDAENIPARFADRIFEEVATIGYASVRRSYGDFTGLWSTAWAAAFARHAVVPRQHFRAGSGKNSADIALVVDAMELLSDTTLDGICLVSSDSDFSPLAVRIRERGIALYGFGRADTPERFRQACRRFIYLENLPARDVSASMPPNAKVLVPVAQAAGVVRRALMHAQTQEGWALLQDVEQLLRRFRADFDPRTYGHRNLLSLVQRTKEFAIDLQHDGGPRIRFRRKVARSPGVIRA